MSRAKSPVAAFAMAFSTLAAACASAPVSEEAKLREAMEEALKPASQAEIDAANRADPLTKANFWSREYMKNGEDAGIALNFARALRELGSHDRALEVVQQTLLVHPNDPELNLLLGRIQMSLNRPEAAVEVFAKVTRLAPRRADGWGALGTAYDHLDQPARAHAAYETALSIEPDRTVTLTNYGLSLALAGDLAGAEAMLRRAAANPDASVKVHENLALVLGLQGRFDEMKTLSSARAPARVAEANAALIEAMVAPARRWEALSETRATSPKAAIAGPEAPMPTNARQLRGLSRN